MHDADPVWALLLAAAAAVRRGFAPRGGTRYGLAGGALREVGEDHPGASLAWRHEGGWEARTPTDREHEARFDLYLPLCAARADHPLTIGHLGQSLDGCIATADGESRFVTGRENIVHLHRLRALCDAVIVGASTVAEDDPRLTTRLVPGEHALRVVLDPRRRLGPGHRVFSDGQAPTLLVCDAAHAGAGPQRVGHAEVAGIGSADGQLDLAALLAALRERGCSAVFVEGGGTTVSAFLRAGLLDRLHLTIAPLFIGAGRPGVRLAASALADCLRPSHRVFRMGGDLLFDCDLRAGPAAARVDQPLTRVL